MNALNGWNYSARERVSTLSSLVDPVLQRLRHLGLSSDAEPQILQSFGKKHKVYASGSILLAEGATANGTAKFLVSGWACRQRLMLDGRRQIFGFLIPGDVLVTHLKETGCQCSAPSTAALTKVTTVDVTFPGNRNAPSGFESAIILATSETESLLHDHIVRLGRMSAVERMAHLLLELYCRLARVGLASEQSFPLPLSQEVLGEALGFSAVHVNRTLQQLRADKLIAYAQGRVTLLDGNRLAALAGQTLDSAQTREHSAN